MTRPMKIDFVSDVSCPWCIIGLKGLETALERVGDLVAADIRFQPFELNPAMPAGGQDLAEHIEEKYGSTPEEFAASSRMIRERAAAVGFDITSRRSRIYNTFNAHRLLHWAGLEGRQQELKHALFSAYFTRGEDPGDTDVLVTAALEAGLDSEVAKAVLASDRYGDDVRAAEREWQAKGITSVPAVIVDDRYLISGGQPPEAFEQALRTIAAEG
ncbi:DSBA oxidoreductase [Aureimonas sp. SA4125]|uniref:DsbA family oxidoreductase n=1 Tax=Aureimonas sp. SA4125 TaxID=2826993 RepID=UPI001CC68676|nr:DsbA family oxidoreductase [Aureimonas sp. SA4125]BDA86751.1 DSBA oxidoreductase [Aureimonas sp. SA4125]